MIEHTIVSGRPAAVAYINERFEPVERDNAQFARVLFDDGGSAILSLQPQMQDFNPYHEPAGSPEGGRFAEAPGGGGGEGELSVRSHGTERPWQTVPAPKKSMIGYKTFNVGKDGQLYPAKVPDKRPVPVGKWVAAEFRGEVSGLKPRMGFHLIEGELPLAEQLRNKKKEPVGHISNNRVWARIRVATDTEVPGPTGKQLLMLKPGEFYPHTEGDKHWIIGGSMKIEKILSDKEVYELLEPHVGKQEALRETHVTHTSQLRLRSIGSETKKLQEYGEVENSLLTDMTGFESEGIIGFLTPDGHAYNTDDSHEGVAQAAGTSLGQLLEEGTFRVYANGSDTLGIEAHVQPTPKQLTELIKLARAGNYDRFVIDTGDSTPADYRRFEGHVTPAAVRGTVERAFSSLHLTQERTRIAPKLPAFELRNYDPGQNAFLAVANDTTTSKNVYSTGHFWRQQGPQQKIEDQASRAVVEIGGENRELMAVVSVNDNDEHRVCFQAGDAMGVVPSYEVYEMFHSDRSQNFKAIHNHPLPYTLSNGDITWMNANLQVKSIREDDLLGGWSEASIPGREQGEYVKWENMTGPIMDFHDRVSKKSYTRGDAPLRRVERDMGRQFTKGTHDFKPSDLGDVPVFLKQHAQSVGMHNAGIIDYSFKLSEWQQHWADRYKNELAEVVEIATSEAEKMKREIEKKTYILSGNEFWPK